jgi:hypothetical protein
MQVWPDVVAGLRELRRILAPSGRIALGFTPYSGQPRTGVVETLAAARVAKAHLVESETAFSALATKP